MDENMKSINETVDIEPDVSETMPETPAEPTRYTDEDGTWEDYGGIKVLIEPSDAWREANPNEKPAPPPEPPSVWDELAAAYQEGVNSLDK